MRAPGAPGQKSRWSIYSGGSSPPHWRVEDSGAAILLSHPDSNFWDKTLNLHYRASTPETKGEILGRGEFGEIRWSSTWTGLSAAWPDHREKVRAALGLR
ncbi:MAG TPA: hypothetical protein VJB14_14485 [Planctomycetota bacterium]|nr:hypothetical protein [Planctomycetota bacterium]